MWFFNKKQKYISLVEFASNISSIAVDYSKLKANIENLKIGLFNVVNKNRNTRDAIAGLVETLKNTSTKKQLSSKNKIANNQEYTTEELYNFILDLLG